jgi:hypothetical protein
LERENKLFVKKGIKLSIQSYEDFKKEIKKLDKKDNSIPVDKI